MQRESYYSRKSIIKILEMETELIDGVADPQSSSLEKVRVLEGNDVGDGKMGSGIKMEKEENGKILVSCQAPCSEKVSDSKGQDARILKHDNGKNPGPATPFADREIIEVLSSSDKTEEEDTTMGYQTPTESIFDPFAPGPEDLMLAPKKKIMRESKIPFIRQLIFHSSKFMETPEANAYEDDAEEDRLLECIHKSFLNLIVSSEVKEISAQIFPVECNLSEGSKTPTSLPLLTGVAEKCPATPIRQPVLKARRLSPKISRKLEFGGNSGRTM